MAVNETINATIDPSIVVEQVKGRFLELVTAPYNHSSLLWITIPLLIALLFMTLYFGIYKKEELGWNTAVGNSLALVFVAMDLFRHMYQRLADPSLLNLVFQDFRGVLVVFFLGLWGLWLLIADFFHVLPKKLAYWISSSIPVTLLAYMAIILTYTDIPLDYVTIIAVIVLAIVLIVVLKIIKFLMPVSLKE